MERGTVGAQRSGLGLGRGGERVRPGRRIGNLQRAPVGEEGREEETVWSGCEGAERACCRGL